MVCWARCFGLPLCSAIAREALAQRLGLLLLGAMGLFLYFVAIAYNKPVICFFNCKTDALNPAPCSLLQICRFLLWAERCRGYNLNSRNASGREEGPNKKRAMSY